VFSLAGDEVRLGYSAWVVAVESASAAPDGTPGVGGYSSSNDEGDQLDLRRHLDFEGHGCRCSTSEIPDQYRSDRRLGAAEHTLIDASGLVPPASHTAAADLRTPAVPAVSPSAIMQISLATGTLIRSPKQRSRHRLHGSAMLAYFARLLGATDLRGTFCST
jgi:hypothetical protein